MKLSLAKLLTTVPEFLEKGFDKNASPQFGRDANAALCWVSKEGKMEGVANTSCYAGLSRNPYNKKLLTVASMLFYGEAKSWRKSTYKPTKEELTAYMEYILNESPYAEAFLTKDVRSVMRTKTLFMDVNQPANYMVAAMITTRYTHEFPHWIKMWNDLVNVGINPDLAWLIIHCTSYKPENGDSFGLTAISSGHAALCTRIPLKQAKNFLAHEKQELNKKYINQVNYCDYHGFDKIWLKGLGYGCAVSSNLTDLLKALVKKEKGVAKSTNPFATTYEERNTVLVSHKNFLDIISKNQEKILEEIKNA